VVPSFCRILKDSNALVSDSISEAPLCEKGGMGLLD